MRLEHIDYPEELTFTDQRRPGALPPRAWKKRGDIEGAVPELDAAELAAIEAEQPSRLEAEALEWHDMKPRERAGWLEDPVLQRTAARMSHLHADGWHLKQLERRGGAGGDPTDEVF